jgi:hypothetical protein
MMKTFYSKPGWLVVAATLIITVSACTKNDIDSIFEQPVASPEQIHMLSVSAAKGDVATRALNLSGSTLNAAWAAGEQVTVYNVTKDADLGGYLEAQAAGSKTTLTGALTGIIENGDELKLKFLSPNYTSQNGTLEYIAAHCDYAEATVTVTSTSGTITTTDANFVNQQAIVMFTLKNSGGTAISANAFCVLVDGNTYSVMSAPVASEIYVAIPGFSGKKVELFAKVDTDWYSYEKSGITFTNGQYYTIAVKMAQTGILPGKFSIDGTTQVRFSQGNLKYDGSNWSFHANQYDMVIKSSGTQQSSYPMDLFCWGNVNNPDYKGGTYITGYVNLSGDTDWGSNMGAGWYTLSKNQWSYLFDNHTYGAATVKGVHGVIVLPDGYAGTAINSTHSGWNDNTIADDSAWTPYETSGAVFLPAAGFSIGYVYDVGAKGYYWSSTAYDSEHSWQVGITSSVVSYTGYNSTRNVGRSVRLVRNVN